MALTQGQLGLTVRVRNETMVADIPASVKAAEQWLEQLPIADMGETASKVFHYLYDLNQSPLAPKERLQILEAIVPMCETLIDSLSEVYVHSPLKYSQKLQSASELVHALASELVFGFNAVIEDLSRDPQLLDKYGTTILPAACANSLHYLGEIQLQRYQLYKSVGGKIWRQQNIIFKLATSNNFFEHKLRKSSAPLDSVKKQLLINLTLSTCNPYQMKHGEASAIYEALQVLASYVELLPTTNEDTLFAYLPDTEIPPQPANSIESESQKKYGIDLSQTIGMLENSMMEKRGGFLARFKKQPQLNLDEDLKAQVLESWNIVKTRNFIRINSNVSTQVAVGLASSHHFLVERGGKVLHERFFGASKKPSSFQVESLELEQEESQHGFVWKQSRPRGMDIKDKRKNEDAFASIYKPRTFDQRKLDKEDNPYKELKTRVKYQWINGVVKDVSPAGFCVAFEKAPSQYAETNELVTVKNFKNGQEMYNLGLIRWNRWQGHDVFLIGVELISPDAEPVRVTLDWDYAKPAYHHNGLLLPEMPNAGVDSSIILPPFGYRSGQTVAILTPNEEFKIELTRKVIETDNFIQFHYQQRS
ncbi:MAG: hypothetical protein OQJ95_01595 [Kangiella sp.]|nr:hypothetical protein [Kangiella sp.]MCW9028186.1 hypothetical protein [Kangiella sp.]